jgi:hypothetical protein
MRHHLAPALGSALLLLVVLGGCKKDESKPDTVKDTSASDTAAAAPTPTPTPTASASTSPDGGTPGDTTTPGTGTLAVRGPGLDACCSALQAQAKTAAAAQKPHAKQAAQLCQSISGLVKDGKTSHAAALTQLRSAAGGSLPGACH